MSEEPSVHPVDPETTSTPLQRRTLLQLALAATAGAAVSTPAMAQPPQGLPAALNVLLDRATNFRSDMGPNDIRYNNIWGGSASSVSARNAWFDSLNTIDVTNTAPISATVPISPSTTHAGVAAPTNLADSIKYFKTIEATQVAKAQIATARQRVQRLLTAVEREAYWYAYQVGYRKGYEEAKKSGSPPFSANVPVQGLAPDEICNIHEKAHDPATNNLTVPPADLFKPGCGNVTTHAVY